MRYFTVYISDYQRPQRGLNRVPLKQHSEIRQLRPDETQLPARLQYLARTMTWNHGKMLEVNKEIVKRKKHYTVVSDPG